MSNKLISNDVDLLGKASVEITRQQQEIDQLKAQVERLREGLEKHTGWESRADGMLCTMYPDDVVDLLNEPPVQSLAEHDCEVIKKAANWFGRETYEYPDGIVPTDQVPQLLFDYANNISKQEP